MDCIHIQPETGERRLCGTCRGHVEIKLRGCAVHGSCSTHRAVDGVAFCGTCKDKTTAQAKAEPVYEWLLPGIRDPLPTPLINPREWWKLTQFDVRDQHFEALKTIAQAELPEPVCSGRGMIYVGGDGPTGFRSSEYGLQVAVGIRMARHVGYTGPIEWWHDSRVETVKQYLTPDMGDVRVKDFAGYPLRYPVTWWKKLAAIALSEFEEAVFLDADAYMVMHPDVLFDLLKDFAFAYWGKDDKWANDARICPGFDTGGKHGIQGGQLAIHRRKAWRLVVLAHWMGSHGDYYGAEKTHRQVKWNLFGDEDCWPVSLAMLREYGHKIETRELGMITPSQWTHRFSIGKDPVVVHRCNDKMHSFGWKSNLPNAPMDREACEELEEAIRGRERNAVGAPQGWRYRKLTWDLTIFAQVARDNEYEIGDLEGGSVLDVGGNTGCFAWLAKQHGAGRIVSVEPHPDNFIILDWNCKAYAECHQLALYGSFVNEAFRLKDHQGGNTGTAKLDSHGTIPVEVVGFDVFVERTFGDTPVRLLKLDCEGAELSILLWSNRLDQFEEIKAEIHAPDSWGPTIGAITDRLKLFGFEVTKLALHVPDAGQGHLFLRKVV